MNPPVFVELCAGLASVTLSLMGMKPPVSRIGAKTGYARAICDRAGIWTKRPRHIVLIDKDPAICNVLQEMVTKSSQRELLAYLCSYTPMQPRAAHARAMHHRFCLGPAGAAAWLMWTASSRGGVGGFKGAHKLRPNVDGFIPSRESLMKRVAKFDQLAFPSSIEVRCANVMEVEPIPDATVYIDPPYEGTEGYEDHQLEGSLFDLAERWRSAGCRVVVSERVPLPWGKGWPHVNITKERVGQCRRSMTKSVQEWLTIGGRP